MLLARPVRLRRRGRLRGHGRSRNAAALRQSPRDLGGDGGSSQHAFATPRTRAPGRAKAGFPGPSTRARWLAPVPFRPGWRRRVAATPRPRSETAVHREDLPCRPTPAPPAPRPVASRRGTYAPPRASRRRRTSATARPGRPPPGPDLREGIGSGTSTARAWNRKPDWTATSPATVRRRPWGRQDSY